MKKTVSILTALLLAVAPVARGAYAQETNVQVQQNVEESKASKVLDALKGGANKVVSGVKFAGNKAYQGVKFASNKAYQGVKLAGQTVAEHPGVTAAVVGGAAVAGSAGYVAYNTYSNWDKIVDSYKTDGSFFSKIKDILKLAVGVKIENNTENKQEVDITESANEDKQEVNNTESANEDKQEVNNTKSANEDKEEVNNTKSVNENKQEVNITEPVNENKQEVNITEPVNENK